MKYNRNKVGSQLSRNLTRSVQQGTAHTRQLVPAERFLEWKGELGYSHPQMGILCGVRPDTAKKWSKEDSFIPKSVIVKIKEKIAAKILTAPEETLLTNKTK